MNIIKTHIVPDNISEIRFYDYACKVFTNIQSRKGVKKAIKRGELTINGENVSSGKWVKTGDILELLDLDINPPKTYNLKLDVIFEDDDIAIINKPAGLIVSGNQFKTVQNAILFNLAKSSCSDALKWPKPVHRLDSATSGLLLIAKTHSAQINLGNQFKNKEITKRYRAIVIGKIIDKGFINSIINEKESKSEYWIVKNINSLTNDWLSLVDLFPHTGRTHQLRIHMSDFGYPIMGDKLYGNKGQMIKGKGLFLAAVELSFIHPKTKENTIINIDQPHKFDAFLKREQARWEKYI